jgi:hypothetical protein
MGAASIRRVLVDAFEWCLPRQPGSPSRGLAASLAGSIGLMLLATAAIAPPIRGLDTARFSGTHGAQFESAVNWAICGRYGQITSGIAENLGVITLMSITTPDAYDRSVIEYIEQRAGSVERYCRLPATMAVVEHGLVLLEGAALQIAPRLTLRGLARLLAVARFAMIATFGWFLLWAGCSVFVTGLLLGLGTYLVALQSSGALYTAYPFFMPVIVAGIGFAGFAVGARPAWVLPAACLALGLWAGFVGNLRTSHYPIALAVPLLLIAWNRVSWRRSLVAAVALALGLVVFDASFMAPLRAKGVDSNHVVAHSLVLGLDNPPSDLSRREGIRWDDSLGIVFARRIDPQAKYLGPTYESSLFSYYRQLWQRYPAEMLGLYVHKLVATTDSVFSWLSQTGPDIFWDSKNGWFVSACAALVRPLSSVVTLGGTLALLLPLSLVLRSRWGAAATWPLLAVGTCGLLGFIEAAVILGSVNLQYNAVLIYATLFAGLIPLEAGLRWISRRRVSPTDRLIA